MKNSDHSAYYAFFQFSISEFEKEETKEKDEEKKNSFSDSEKWHKTCMREKHIENILHYQNRVR